MSTRTRCVEVDRRHLNASKSRYDFERRRRGGNSESARHRWDAVGLIRQNDRVPVMIRGDELGGVTVVHPVAVGRQARAEHPEKEHQETCRRLMNS